MIARHRWQYQNYLRGYKCVGLPVGGVESHQWCVGCGCFIGEKEIYESNYNSRGDNGLRNLHLDILARGKGSEPIEANTLAAWRLKQKTKV